MDKRTDVSLPLDITEVSEAVVGEKVGYARVSSKEQNLERQTEQLRKKSEVLPISWTEKSVSD
ncbi:recombinase family protein [Corynebacterium pseudodiphtheriticum]|uniref:recombinase family protein n=1 Tax=Corynebacterium pseudodiphtheriticum TaxID=37637 RepID=UPI00254394A3|nr:recombinase family protein [Corynebacterium pseudodiphtheriticum]MDK4327717.1 recombinase family protein [Corynebacterium pseudodiphtheriticum]